jgi:hypothetical protein
MAKNECTREAPITALRDFVYDSSVGEGVFIYVIDNDVQVDVDNVRRYTLTSTKL